MKNWCKVFAWKSLMALVGVLTLVGIVVAQAPRMGRVLVVKSVTRAAFR